MQLLLIHDCHIRYSGSNEHDDGEGDAEGEVANGLEGNFVTPVSVNRPPRRYIFHKQDKIPKTYLMPAFVQKRYYFQNFSSIENRS